MKRVRKYQSVIPYKEVNHYQPDYARQAFFLCLLGATDVLMSKALGVSISCVQNWKRNKPEFISAIQKGKIEADANVANSLYQAANGYSHPDKVILTNRVKEFDDNGRVVKEWTEPLIVDTVKHYPPSVPAAIKWLSSRQPGVWGDTSKVDINAKVTVSHEFDLSDFSMEELAMMKKLGVQRLVEDIPYEEQ